MTEQSEMSDQGFPWGGLAILAVFAGVWWLMKTDHEYEVKVCQLNKACTDTILISAVICSPRMLSHGRRTPNGVPRTSNTGMTLFTLGIAESGEAFAD